MKAAVTKNKALEARRLDYERRCSDFMAWLLPQMVWDTAPRGFLFDAYEAWCTREGLDPISRTRFYLAVDWAAWNGKLGAWGPVKRSGEPGPTRFEQDQPVADDLGLDQWQPSKGFDRPRSMYAGIGR